MWEHSGTFVAIAGFVLQFIVILAACIWKIAQLKTDLLAAIAITGKEIDERIDRQKRDFGESVAAIRQKVHDVETWARDTFVRHDSFYKLTDEIRADIRAVGGDIKQMGTDIQTRIDRMDGGKDRSD